jgi:hypothetical protein
MNRRAILWLAAPLFLSVPGMAQPAQPAAQRPEPTFYEFKHLDRESAGAVAHLASSLFNVGVEITPPLHVAVITPMRNAVPDWREKTLDFLKRYDVPPPAEPQVHYVAYLIRASNAKSEADGQHLSPIPKPLDEAIAEMKSSLIYARYDLLTIVTSVSQGAASASDRLPSVQASPDYNYTIEYDNVTVAPDRKSVTISPFRFALVRLINDKVASSISSNITVREGQKLVLGKVRMSDDADVFVVLTVKVE